MVVGPPSKMDVDGRGNRKYDVVDKFPEPSVIGLLQLTKRSSADNYAVFTKDYSRILSCLKLPLNEYQKDALQALMQFYN